jgi:Tfp pilus assembly protein PilN
MPQQINLFHPVLLAPRRHFPALALVQGLGLWAVALVLLSSWSIWRTHSLQANADATRRVHEAERTQLTLALAQRQADGGDPAALAQELARADGRLAERRAQLQALGGDERSPTGLLQQLAASIPAPVWLTEIEWTPGRLSLTGQTLYPEALQPWLAQLGPPGSVRVERRDDQAPGWSFRISQAHTPPITAFPSGPAQRVAEGVRP